MDDIKKIKQVAALLHVSMEDVPKALKRFKEDVDRIKGTGKA